MLAVIKKDQTVLDVEEKFACCRNGQAYQEKKQFTVDPGKLGDSAFRFTGSNPT